MMFVLTKKWVLRFMFVLLVRLKNQIRKFGIN